jgi:hypothetical protein
VQCGRAAFAFLGLCLAACGGEDPKEAVAAGLADPPSARFQSVRDRGDYVCGEVNSRERPGGYGGYRRFVYDKGSETAAIDPGLDEPAEQVGPQGPGCAKPFAYQSVEERLTCAAAPERQAGSNRQRAFEALWRRVCG